MKNKFTEYKNHILPYELIFNKLLNIQTPEEEFIFNSLKGLEENKKSILIAKKNLGKYRKEQPPKKDYSAYLDVISKNLKHLTPVKVKKSSKSPSINPGQVWKAKRIPRFPERMNHEVSALERYLIILSGPFYYHGDVKKAILKKHPENRIVLALPVSFETQFALPEDVIFGGSEYLPEFMIETRLEFNAIAGNLEKYIFSLDEKQVQQMLNVYFKSHEMEYNKKIYNTCTVGEMTKSGILYKEIEEKNLDYLRNPVIRLGEYFETLSEPVYEPLKLISRKINEFIDKYLPHSTLEVHESYAAESPAFYGGTGDSMLRDGALIPPSLDLFEFNNLLVNLTFDGNKFVYEIIDPTGKIKKLDYFKMGAGDLFIDFDDTPFRDGVATIEFKNNPDILDLLRKHFEITIKLGKDTCVKVFKKND